jgi:hypothetical protein
MDFQNPNVAGEMAQMLLNNHKKYVPTTSSSADSTDTAAIIPLHGDQIFEERARNVQWTFQDGDTNIDRLEGLTTEFADWHAKVTLYEVLFDTLSIVKI